MLEVIELKPATAARWAIVGMHGLGDKGSNLIAGNSLLGFSFKNSVIYLLPNAPQRFVSYAGTTLPAWFEISNFGTKFPEEDATSLVNSATEIHNLINQLLTQTAISSDHVILLGFSQGGVLALQSGLTYPKPLGGIVSLSAWLPRSFTHDGSVSHFNVKTPLFWGYGKDDELIPATWTETSLAALKCLGCTNLINKQYADLGHGINYIEQQDLQTWLSTLIDR